ncbi:hypothetical protein ABFS83_02G151500 [Erythranthe nasuta]
MKKGNMKLAFLIIMYTAISTFLGFFLRFSFVNQPQNLHLSQIFTFTAFYILSLSILYINSDSHSLTDEFSCLVVTAETSSVEFPGRNQEMTKNIKKNISDESQVRLVPVPPPFVYKDRLFNHDLAGVHNLCGYEGDNEDNGDDEDEEFDKRVEEFIAAKKRVWREEMIKERLL